MSIRPTGAIAPLATPVSGDGGVGAEGIRRQVDAVRPYISGLMPCISSGEGWRLTRTQWLTATRETLRSAAGLPVYAGCQATEWEEVESRARQAEDLGADAVVLSVPTRHGLTSNGELIARFSRIREQVDVPIVFYWESFISGWELDVAAGIRLCEVLGAVAIKDSMRDKALTRALTDHFAGSVSILQGWEDLLLPELPVDGYVGPLALLSSVAATVFTDEPRWDDIALESKRFGTLDRDYIARVKAELHRRGVFASAAEFPGVDGVDWDA